MTDLDQFRAELAGSLAGLSPSQRLKAGREMAERLGVVLAAIGTDRPRRREVARLDRQSRARRPGRRRSPGRDLTTSNGRLVARMLAAISEDERDRIRQRTKAALAAKKAAGVRLGRPSTLPAEVVARIVTDRASGVSFGKIAAALNADGVPTAQGGKRWYPATVKAVVSGQDAARMRAEK